MIYGAKLLGEQPRKSQVEVGLPGYQESHSGAEFLGQVLGNRALSENSYTAVILVELTF